MQHQMQPFSASKYSGSFQKANKYYLGPFYSLQTSLIAWSNCQCARSMLVAGKTMKIKAAQ